MIAAGRLFWLGAALLLLVLAAWFWPEGAAPVPGVVGLPGRDSAATLEVAAQPATAATASEATKVQEMIASGKFSPPPGDTQAMYSIASPFSSSGRSPEAGSAPAERSAALAPAGSQPQFGPQGAALVGAPREAHVAAPALKALGQAVVANQPADQPTNLSTNLQASGLPTPSASTQRLEFETPPGVGSAKGGQ